MEFAEEMVRNAKPIRSASCGQKCPFHIVPLPVEEAIEWSVMYVKIM